MVSTFVMFNTINFRIKLIAFGFSLFVLIGQESGASVKFSMVITSSIALLVRNCENHCCSGFPRVLNQYFKHVTKNIS